MSQSCSIFSTCVLASCCLSDNYKQMCLPQFETIKKGQLINIDKKYTFVIVSGIGKIICCLSNNEIFDFVLLGKGQIFGEMLPFIKEELLVEFLAITNVTICKISCAGLQRYAKQNPTILYDLFKVSGSNYISSFHIRWIMNGPKLYDQVKRLLLVLNQINGKDSEDFLAVTHDEIALILKADRSSVSLALEKLQKEGVVEIGYRKVRLADSANTKELQKELKSIRNTYINLWDV